MLVCFVKNKERRRMEEGGMEEGGMETKETGDEGGG
jgi:hypothetical protein